MNLACAVILQPHYGCRPYWTLSDPMQIKELDTRVGSFMQSSLINLDHSFWAWLGHLVLIIPW